MPTPIPVSPPSDALPQLYALFYTAMPKPAGCAQGKATSVPLLTMQRVQGNAGTPSQPEQLQETNTALRMETGVWGQAAPTQQLEKSSRAAPGAQ